MNGQKGSGSIILTIILLLVLGGYLFWKDKSAPEGAYEGEPSSQESVYDEVKNLTGWQMENIPEWSLSEVSPAGEKLKEFPKGPVIRLTKTFNGRDDDMPESGDIEKWMEKVRLEEKDFEEKVRSELKANGWVLAAGPAEGGFYHDYLYLKAGRPLVLSTGTRDAVTGGIYVGLQFLAEGSEY